MDWWSRSYPTVGSRGAHSINVDRCPFRQLAGHHPPRRRGSERYVHRMAEGLAGAGLRVSLFCAAHDRAPADEVVNGVRVVRRGGRLSVYPRALLHVLRHRPRLVVDAQNGLPFGSSLVTRRPVVVLVHHVHREQWPIVFGRLGGAIGWGVESVLAPGSIAGAVTSRCPAPRRR